MRNRWLPWLVLWLLASCGGAGDEAPRDKAQAVRASAAVRASNGVTTAGAAEQLMNFAESSYAQLFPGRKATQSFPPFAFRYYPETGIYLGVVVSEGGGYALNGVYALGGPFGATPFFVGPLTAFITPDPAAANNGCYDLALLDTPGARIARSVSGDGAAPFSATEEIVVGGLTVFEGHEVREIVTTVTVRLAEGTGSGTGTDYVRVTGPAEITHYGFVSTETAFVGTVAATIAVRAVATPPSIDRSFGLAPGETVATTETLASTTTTRGLPGVPEEPQSSTDTVDSTIRFLGRETITVPAGTYDTCKFEETFNSDPTNTSTTWVIFGKGIEVKVVNRGGGTVETEVATSITLNGQAL